jgi:hypothetical protein
VHFTPGSAATARYALASLAAYADAMDVVNTPNPIGAVKTIPAPLAAVTPIAIALMRDRSASTSLRCCAASAFSWASRHEMRRFCTRSSPTVICEGVNRDLSFSAASMRPSRRKSRSSRSNWATHRASSTDVRYDASMPYA